MNTRVALLLTLILIEPGSALAGSHDRAAQPDVLLPTKNNGSRLASNDDAERARKHYEHAIQHYDGHHYDRALAEFRQAYALRPSSQLLFNIGQVEFLLQHYTAAHRTLTEYVRTSGNGVSRERRAQVLAQLAELTALTGRVRVTVNAAGAQVEVNGETVGLSPLVDSVRVDPGLIRVRASLRGRGAVLQEVAVPANAEAVVKLTLDSAPIRTGGHASSPVVTWIIAGALGTAALGTGVATMLTARHYADMRARSVAPDRSEQMRNALDEQRSLVATLATSTDVLAAVALASASLSVYLTLSSDSDETVQKLSFELGRNRLVASGRF